MCVVIENISHAEAYLDMCLRQTQIPSLFTKHLTGQFDEVWFFENEPVNLYAVERALPDVHLVFFDSVHSRKMTSPDHMMSLSGRFK